MEQDYTMLKEDYKILEEEYEPYKELAEAEKQKKLDNLEAEKKAKEEEKRKEEEQRRKEEEEKKKAEEERKEAERLAREEERIGYETGITYDQLARTPDQFIDKKVKFSGKVIQVIEDFGVTDYRFAIDGDYDRIILVSKLTSSNTTGKRILENDYITIYGVSDGLYTYETVLGAQMTVPNVIMDKYE